MRLRRLLAVPALAATLPACAQGPGVDDPPSDLVIAAGEASGVDYRYGQGLARAHSADLPSTTVRARVTSGSVDSVVLLARREAALAFALADTAAEAVAGTGPFREPVPLRALGRLHTNSVHVVVPEASAVDLVADLRGLRVSVGTAGSGTELTATRLQAFGPVDIAVLNGPGPKPGTAAALSADDLDTALSSLVRTQHRLASLVLPGMRERGWGRVLAIGSSGAVSPLPNLAASNVGRAALAGYLKTLSAEVAADGVTVNLLLPRRVATDRLGSLDAAAAERTGRTVEQVQAESRNRIPAGRYGRPEEFGAVGAFLCSELAGYVTGVALRVDGGLVTHL